MLPILALGGREFAAGAAGTSTGTKLFCVCGAVERPGVYEVPFGVTLGGLLEMAGGVPGGRRLQAILLGGAAGVFVRPDELGMPLTFEGARAANATLGSGVIMAFDDTVEHEARNDSGQDRTILIFDVWKPELTTEERDLVAAMFEAIDAYGPATPAWGV